MKPIDKYVAELNGIVNELLNNSLATDINLWNELPAYIRKTSSKMTMDRIGHLLLAERPDCNLYGDNQFNRFCEAFMGMFSEIKSKNTSNLYVDPVKEYLSDKTKEKLVAFSIIHENCIVINKFPNSEFDAFFLSRCLIAVPQQERLEI